MITANGGIHIRTRPADSRRKMRNKSPSAAAMTSASVTVRRIMRPVNFIFFFWRVLKSFTIISAE